MTEESFGNYQFLSWIRQRISSEISRIPVGCRPKLDVKLNVIVEGEPIPAGEMPSIPVSPAGPVDVVEFDSDVVIKTDPLPNVMDFEPNFMVSAEFASESLPWLTSPLPIDENDRLHPWISLIVLKRDDGEIKKIFRSNDNLPPSIVVDTANLPNLEFAWRWAHVQVTSEESLTPAVLEVLLHENPEKVISRLICPRRLEPGVAYHAFIVPTFKLGLQAGTGQNLDAGITELAWNENDGEITLCYYFDWEFGTGQRGDFEYLVRQLVPRKLSGLGIREIDCSDPGYGLSPVIRTDENAPHQHSLGMEGALRSWDTQLSPWGADRSDQENTNSPFFQIELAEKVLNKPRADMEMPPGEVPKVVPPIYGRWHKKRNKVDPDNSSWLDTLNLDPRHRIAAGFGAQVVRENQEALMAATWEQLGDLRKANELLRRAQFACGGSMHIFRRLEKMPRGEFLRFAGPLNRKVRVTNPTDGSLKTPHFLYGKSRIPSAALDPAFRRIVRNGGYLRKRQAKDTADRGDLLDRLNEGELAAAGDHPDPDGLPDLCDITFHMLERLGVGKLLGNKRGEHTETYMSELMEKYPNSFLCDQGFNCDTLIAAMEHLAKLKKQDIGTKKNAIRERLGKKPVLRRFPDIQNLLAIEKKIRFSKIFCEVLETWLDVETDDIQKPIQIDLELIRTGMLRAINPENSIPRRVNKRLRIEGIGDRKDPCSEIKIGIEFPQPMYKPLQEISQELLLPGVETIPQNTVGLLKTNRRFVESYMCGCNDEKSREDLWREVPTFLDGTPFRQFWDVGNYVPSERELNELREKVLASSSENELLLNAEILKKVEELLRGKLKDIPPIREWGDKPLGHNINGADENNSEPTVLIVRGDLLKKYPNAVIRAVRAIYKNQATGETIPAAPEFLSSVAHLSNSVDQIVASNPPKYPTFSAKLQLDSAKLQSDITFFGFDITNKDELKGTDGSAGWYIEFSQPVGEIRYGLDECKNGELPEVATWDDLCWDHFDIKTGEYINGTDPIQPPETAREGIEWDSAASIAWITAQKPIRIFVHAKNMIPDTSEISYEY